MQESGAKDEKMPEIILAFIGQEVSDCAFSIEIVTIIVL